MDIHFPGIKEIALLEAMKSRANSPWQWQAHNTFGKPPDEGSFYFHRDKTNSEPPCTVCIHRIAPGHLRVQTIVPDAMKVHIPADQYVAILNEFDSQIATPVTEALNGMTSIGTSKHTLEDHFSPEAVKLLEHFCTTSNVADHGTHLSDQGKWMAFLLQVHRNNENVHCDTFGACLTAKKWWPEDGIRTLVDEYDFAMRLLEQAEI